jgi:Peptidase family M41
VEKITLGPARHILLNPVDRECTAYHESGHALLGLLVPGSDPVHRVTIVSRGMALGQPVSSPRTIAPATPRTISARPRERSRAVAGDEVSPGWIPDRLFRDWRMHWSLREFFAFADGSGGAFLWDAELTHAAGGKTTEISGMDLVLLCGVRLSRNEVYFDRTALFGDGSK